MRTREVRRRCHRRLNELRARGLVVPRPFDADRLCRRIGACLDVSITPVAVPMPNRFRYGMTLFTDNGLIILYEERTSRFHQDLIIAHELGHILFDHEAVDLDDAEAALMLTPSLRPSLVRRVMGRRSGEYSEVEEREAETMATILVEAADRDRDDRPAGPLDPRDAVLYDRLRGSFEHPER